MYIIPINLILSLALMQESPRMDKPLLASQAFMVSASVTDVVSSRGLYENNPILGRGPFGTRQAAVSLGITGLAVAVEYPLVRKFPKSKRTLEILNYGIGAIHIGAAIHNWRQ